MSQYYNNLVDNFKKISRKKWIKSINNNRGGVGQTFENELNKKADSLYLPDYEGIELKCTTRYSNYPLYLFTIAFDGPTYPEINRLINLYGYYDKDFKNKKVLFTKLSLLKPYIVNHKYKFKLCFDKKEDKLFLEVYDIKNNLLEKKSFVYMQSIYKHLMLKFEKMALIYAYKKNIDCNEYFRYYMIKVYEIFDFKVFVELLEKGIILVDLIARINKSGVDKGRYRNKNLVFSIKKDDIDKLFKKIYEFNSDIFENKKSNNFFIMD